MPKHKVVVLNAFRKDYRALTKRGYDMSLLQETVELLADGDPLPERYRDHALAGDFIGCRECHIKPDWLLIYRLEKDELILYLMRTGSHSDLFS